MDFNRRSKRFGRYLTPPTAQPSWWPPRCLCIAVTAKNSAVANNMSPCSVAPADPGWMRNAPPTLVRLRFDEHLSAKSRKQPG